MATVDDVQSAIAAVVDQDEDTSNISNDDYSLRLEYMNQRERKWAESGSWDVLYEEYNTLTSTSSGNVTVSLPTDFRKLASFPVITYDGSDTKAFPEIDPKDKERFSSSDRYIYLLGNEADGYNMIVHPGTSSGQMASGASIYIPIYKNPASLASPADTVTCPNPQYLIEGVIADVWEAREDARFQIKKAEANTILLNLLEQENTPSVADNDNEVKTVEQTKHSFRWGE